MLLANVVPKHLRLVARLLTGNSFRFFKIGLFRDARPEAVAHKNCVAIDSLSVNSDILCRVNPRLIAISGSCQGTTFVLNKPEVSIGREASNQIPLNDLSVSRRHCVIKMQEGTTDGRLAADDQMLKRESQAVTAPPGNVAQFTIIDLESFNGTFVNGLPVKEQPLCDGDQIAVGDVVLLFLLHEIGVPQQAATSSGNNLITRSTLRLRREDARYLRPEMVLDALPASARMARDLNSLLKISATINSTAGLAELQEQLLGLIREVVPAERQAILLSRHGEFVTTCGWTNVSGPDNSLRVSQTVLGQVLREGVALLSNDVFETEGLEDKPSLIGAQVCSLISAPIALPGETLGAIYLDTSNNTTRFDEGHLQLLTAIAAIAAAPIKSALQFEWLEAENQRLKEEIQVNHQMVGVSPAMRAVYEFIGRAAPTDATVLVSGESGTGKELAARAIHLNSARAGKPFIVINGATLSETLLESELFGHEKGAFTGAIAQKRGKLELADGGTLFLDEVGELTPLIQAKLLRVLQEHEFERVGGIRPIKVDVRLVAATNKNLEEAVAQNTFRQDLYYRLNVVAVTMPPLRDRQQDIQLLASYFASAFSKKCKRRIRGISPEARALLSDYDWPGNVRELQNAIERAVVLGSTELITPEDLPEPLVEREPRDETGDVGYHHQVKKAKKRILLKAIEDANGNYTEAAKQLGLHSTNLHRLIRNLAIRSALKK